MRSLTARGVSLALAAALIAGVPACGTAPQAAARATGSLTAAQATEPSLSGLPTESFEVPTAATRMPGPMTTGNAAELHVSSQETVAALKSLIGGAKRSVRVEVYNYINDSMGKPITDLLAAKAREGVEVKVVADWVGSRTRPGYAEMVRTLKAAGVDYEVYRPRLILKHGRALGVNINHRKLYLADGERALIGGVNLRAPFDSHTQDVLVEWRGPVVAELYKEFALSWKHAGGRMLPLIAMAPARPGTVRSQVVVTSPREGRYEIAEALANGIAAAQKEICIENQYLWDDKLVKQLHAALKRGVKLRVIVPGDEDKGIFKYIHAEELQRLVNAGAEAHLYTGHHPEAHLHTKYFGIDDQWVAIGSANGDTRALNDNQEIDTIIQDPKLATEFRTRLFEKDWHQDSKPFVYKPGSVVTRPFRSLLELIDYFL